MYFMKYKIRPLELPRVGLGGIGCQVHKGSFAVMEIALYLDWDNDYNLYTYLSHFANCPLKMVYFIKDKLYFKKRKK